jgi:hypothetical protein
MASAPVAGTLPLSGPEWVSSHCRAFTLPWRPSCVALTIPRTEPQVQLTNPPVLNNHSNDFKSHCTFPIYCATNAPSYNGNTPDSAACSACCSDSGPFVANVVHLRIRFTHLHRLRLKRSSEIER